MFKRVVLASLLSGFLLPVEARAFVLEAVTGGAAGFGIGLGLSPALERARLTGNELIARGNDAAEERLQQLDDIVQAAIRDGIREGEAAAKRILAEAEAKVLRVERELMADLRKEIFNLTCAGTVATDERIPELLGPVVDLVGGSSIKVTVPVAPEEPRMCGWPFRPDCPPTELVVEINQPFVTTFDAIERYLLAELQRVSDDDYAMAIVGTYDYLSRLSERASCFTAVPGERSSFTERMLKYRSLSEAWNTAVVAEPRSWVNDN